jgi:hypothetical protein
MQYESDVHTKHRFRLEITLASIYLLMVSHDSFYSMSWIFFPRAYPKIEVISSQLKKFTKLDFSKNNLMILIYLFNN